MPEGLSPNEVAKELDKHRAESQAQREDTPSEEKGRARLLTIVEAVLLAVVAVLAAWSGYASAKWGTESSLKLAKASAARTEANRSELDTVTTKNFDASTFNAWFDAYAVNNVTAEQIAINRFSPAFRRAFDAWMATDPETNPHAPKGPTYMPEYVQPGAAQTSHLDAVADRDYAAGEADGNDSDNYIRTTVFLASVLFLVGISGHFAVRGARIGLVVVGAVILGFAVALLAVAPKPPL